MSRLPDLEFSEYFLDHNESEHNISATQVLDATIGRRVDITREFTRDGKRRRLVLAATDDTVMKIVLEPADGFAWVISAFPASQAERRLARRHKIGNDSQ
jgi:uncharacterized DUF497 family protein